MTLNQSQAPLLAAMQRYAAAGVTPFYTPGHKMGKGMDPVLAEILGEKALALDLGLDSELDDLHAPCGPIKEAQDLAANLYGADHSFFVINGTTGGIYAMIMTVVGPGDEILVPRNAHRSIIGGIILSGATPVFMQPAIDRDLGLAMGVAPETVAAALEGHPDAKAVLLINPTYYGAAADLRRIVEMVHSYDIPVVVDEAHGPHLRFSERLPVQALDAGADIAAQSTHKILGALTQCSLVHCREGRISVSRLKAMLRLAQSTSPNYLLLASLDVARRQMAVKGRELTEGAVALAQWIREQVNAIPGLYCFGAEKIGTPGIYGLDPTKITVTVKGLGLTGKEAATILRYQYKVQAELSDMYNILFLITLGDSFADARTLVTALKDLASAARGRAGFAPLPGGMTDYCYPEPPEPVLSPREALFGNACRTPFHQSAGKICAEIVAFYPPGIPILCPGEKISREIIDYCLRLQAAGLQVSGPEDYTLHTIKVVSEPER